MFTVIVSLGSTIRELSFTSIFHGTFPVAFPLAVVAIPLTCGPGQVNLGGS